MAEENKTFEGTKTAMLHLVSKRCWYKGVKVGGLPINNKNAWQIKVRLRTGAKLTQDYMQEILISAGYKMIHPVVWQK